VLFTLCETLPGSVQGKDRLLLFRLDRNKTHGWSTDRLANGFGTGCIVFGYVTVK